MTRAAVARALDPLTQGWFHHGAKILKLVEQHRPMRCVELGTWQGASAIPVARSIRRWGGTMTCIDTWGGTVDGTLASQQPWMLLSCVRHMTQAGVNGNTRLIAGTTSEAATWWTDPIDYLYIDADHSYDGVISDLCAWVPKLTPGGLLLGDDYGSDLYPGVQAAWDAYEREHGLTLTRYQSVPPAANNVQLIYGVV